jgi:hypothetical protein
MESITLTDQVVSLYFFPARTLAHLAFCAFAILRLPAALIFHLGAFARLSFVLFPPIP